MTRESLENAAADLAHAIGLLVRRMRAVAASQELSWTESAVMKRLAAEGPATTADLARVELMKPQSMGAIIAALEERAFVERRPHPTDGRQVNIHITALGATVRRSASDAKRAWLAQAIARLDGKERDTLLAAGQVIKRLAEG